MTADEIGWLRRIAKTGTWPDRPFLRDVPTSLTLMRKGLVEVIKPHSPFISYVRITDAGFTALKEAK